MMDEDESELASHAYEPDPSQKSAMKFNKKLPLF